MMKAATLFIVFAVAMGLVGSDDPGVTVALDRRGYAAADTAQVTITREAEGEIVFAIACDLFVEAQCDSGWVTVFEPDCSHVRVRPTRLAQGESLTAPFVVAAFPGGCAPLRLRLRYQAMDDAGYRTVYSLAYEITTR
jgi:hypothetical protein